AHRADLRSKRRTRATSDDDGGDEPAEFAQEADAEEIDRVDLCIEAFQLVGALIGEHDPEQERQHPDDGQGSESGLLDLLHKGRPRELVARRENRLPCLDRDAPQKSDEIIGLVQDMRGAAPDSREKIREGLAPRMIGSGRKRLALQTLIECAIDFRQKDSGDSDTVCLEQMTGAQDQPCASTVQAVYFAS